MATELNYLKSTYLFEGEATLLETGENDKGFYGIFDQTVFYPRGGGQEADTGVILLESENKSVNVRFVAFIEGKVYHYGNFSTNCQLNQPAKMQINQEGRITNSKLHTAGHLIASILETMDIGVRAVKGFHYPEGSYVEFDILQNKISDYDSIIAPLNEQINKDITRDLITFAELLTYDELVQKCHNVPEGLPKDKPLRAVTIEGYFPIPCGGTHVKAIAELAGLQATKAKVKKGQLKVSYGIE